MQASPLIRPFCPDDQASAKSLLLAGLGEHFGFIDHTLNPDLDDIVSSYLDVGCTFLVAEDDHRLVGTGALIPEGAGDGRIVRMSVCPAHRQRGIGRMLLGRLLLAAKQKGCQRVWVETNLDWQGVIAFYRSCGFRDHHCDEKCTHMYVEL